MGEFLDGPERAGGEDLFGPGFAEPVDLADADAEGGHLAPPL